MDYCSSCRRHLDGALVCPDCGAYAPDIDPAIAKRRTGTSGTAAEGPAGWAPTYRVSPPRRHDGTLDDAAGAGAGGLPDDVELPGGTGGSPDDDLLPGTGRLPDGGGTQDDDGLPNDTVYGAPAGAPQGRAARRRQRARRKRTQRRILMATAVALVGGGLTVATVNRHSGNPPQAAMTPDGTSPTSAPPGAGRSTPTPGPTAPSGANGLPGRPPVPFLPNAQADSADALRPAPSPPRPRPTSPSSGDSGPGSGSSGSAADTRTPAPGADPGSPSSSPTPTPTPTPTSSSEEFCILGICL